MYLCVTPLFFHKEFEATSPLYPMVPYSVLLSHDYSDSHEMVSGLSIWLHPNGFAALFLLDLEREA